jgi:hypothetical protein
MFGCRAQNTGLHGAGASMGEAFAGIMVLCETVPLC